MVSAAADLPQRFWRRRRPPLDRASSASRKAAGESARVNAMSTGSEPPNGRPKPQDTQPNRNDQTSHTSRPAPLTDQPERNPMTTDTEPELTDEEQAALRSEEHTSELQSLRH